MLLVNFSYMLLLFSYDYMLYKISVNRMPHSYLKVVGNPEYRCNNSSPRFMRENLYAILVFRLKISYVFKYKISITLLLILICLGKSFLNPLAKIHNLIDYREYSASNNQVIF